MEIKFHITYRNQVVKMRTMKWHEKRSESALGNWMKWIRKFIRATVSVIYHLVVLFRFIITLRAS